MAYATENLKSESVNTLSPLKQQFCPVCNGEMSETYRVRENGAFYVWYDCNKSDCPGSWLEKTAQE